MVHTFNSKYFIKNINAYKVFKGVIHLLH